jgi:raffinose/stachyose/melibiose transport system substrate-binding protein
MSAPGTYVVPARAKNPDAVVCFLHWVHTDETARRITVETTGAAPGGPAALPVPEVRAGSVYEQTLEAHRTLASAGVAIDFIANATPGVYAGAFRPELKLLIAGRTTPAAFAAAIQSAYARELGR